MFLPSPPQETHHINQQLPIYLVSLHNAGYYARSTAGKWKPDVPLTLYEQLQLTQRKRREVQFLSIGRDGWYPDCWFMRRNTGATYWGSDCPPSLTRLLTSGQSVERVFFAPDGGWLAKKGGGSLAWQNLPYELDQAVRLIREDHESISYLSVAPGNGAWVAVCTSGRSEFSGNLPYALAAALRSRPDYPLWVELGPDDTFVALWPDHTLFRCSRDLAEELLSYPQPPGSAPCSGRHSCGCCPPPPPLRPCIRNTSNSQPLITLGGMTPVTDVGPAAAGETAAAGPSSAASSQPLLMLGSPYTPDTETWVTSGIALAGPSTPPGEEEPYIICSGGFVLSLTPGSPPPPLAREVVAAAAASGLLGQSASPAAAVEAAEAALREAEALLSARTAELTASKELVSNLSGKLKDKEKKLQESQGEWQCSVCWSEPLGVAYTGCGHMVCSSCGPMLAECPICRQASPQMKLFRV